ncbi:1-pyrroline-5-carboxylate dehydrogenase [Robbsia andropogonis]|uniref:1-pyrroline-5-carboxylate dehydrogenase n=1 Tax=Robbsia andropogonis TaxID=28092 RepID=UPI003D1BE6CF
MKELIEAHLALVDDSTAKNIAKAIGMPELDVSRELNRMITDGVVERAKRQGGGNEYRYWLTARKPPVDALPFDDAPDFPEVSPAPTAATPLSADMSDVVDADFFHAPDVEPLVPAGDLVELINILGYAAPGPTTIDDCIEAARSVMDGMEKLRQNNAALERRLDDALEEGPRPLLLVTLGREAPARRHTSLESAQKRANVLIKSGKEDTVLVLAPLGKMRRGTEWSPMP